MRKNKAYSFYRAESKIAAAELVGGAPDYHEGEGGEGGGGRGFEPQTGPTLRVLNN